jgi:hypothetical protein
VRATRAESLRLADIAAAELDDNRAEEALRESRAQDRAARRAEARLPELREQLVEAEWQVKQRLFQKYKKDTAAVALRLIAALEEAARINYAAAAIRNQASGAIGSDNTLIPLVAYLGVVLMPDTVEIWKKHTQRALEAMEQHEYPRPPSPRDPNAPQAVYRNPHPGPIALRRGPLPKAAEAPAAQPAQQESPMPAPTPTPKRQTRLDGAPAAGERQITFRSVGPFTLPDGSTAGMGDRVNLPAAEAERIVRSTGAADFVDVQASEPAGVVAGVFDAKIELPFSGKGDSE